MEKGIRHYFLFLKYQVKKPLLWISLFCMAAIVYYLQTVALPGNENTRVLICGASQAEEQRFLDMAKATDTIFQYETASSEDLIQQVQAGKADCGFIWEKELFEEEPWDRKSVRYITGTFTNKGLLAKETTFSILLRIKAETLPLTKEEEIFGEKDKDREKTVLARYQELLGMDSLFSIDFKSENGKMDQQENAYLGKTDLVRGVVALLLFMYCLFGFGVDTLSAEKRPWNYLAPISKEGMLWSRLLAGITVPAVFGFFLIRLMGGHVPLQTEIGKYLLFLLYTLIWCRVLGSLFRKRESFAASFLVILLLHLILCPIFFDIEMFSPVLGGLSYLLPTGWYLR
ncbi:MAG: hypothetical protein IIU45_01545 [Lachnospiraceae bacterium]|nr:hypothetical protein [Lachnospiraceae bacterium]